MVEASLPKPYARAVLSEPRRLNLRSYKQTPQPPLSRLRTGEDREGRRPAQEPSPAFRLDELIPLRPGAPSPVNHIALTRPLPRPRATDATLGVLGRPGAGGRSSALRTLVSFSSHPLPGGRSGCGAERRGARGPTVAPPFPLCPQTPRAFITVVTHKAPRSLPSLAIGWHPHLSRSPSLPPSFGLLIDIP